MADGTYETVLEGSTLWITLCRANKLNALDDASVGRLHQLFAGYKAPLAPGCAVKTIIIKSSSTKAFCVGLDLTSTLSLFRESAGRGKPPPLSVVIRVQRRWSALIRSIARCAVPVVSLIDGFAFGGGFAIALASDMRLATPHARFNVQAINIGLAGNDAGMSWFLPRIVGAAHAAQLMLTGETVSGARAERIGLVNELLSTTSALEARARAIAARIGRFSQAAVTITKETWRVATEASSSLEAQLAMEDRQQALLAAASPDFAAKLLSRAAERKPRKRAKL